MDLTTQRMMMGATSGGLNEPMILVFDTNLGDGSSRQISLPLFGTPLSVNIDWGDGTSDVRTVEGVFSHTYATHGIYTVRIIGFLRQFGNGISTYINANKLIRVENFGNTGLVSLRGAFRDAANLTDVPNNIPSTVTDLSYCFNGASTFNDSKISSWDVSNVTTIALMFFGATSFNQNIGSWNVSNVFNFVGTFFDATSFNQNISSWNMSAASSTGFLFYGASSFNQNIGSWNMSNVTNMTHMFAYATSFNNGGSNSINNWDVSNVSNMQNMFFDAYNFNQPLNSWDTSNVTIMSGMFYATDINVNFHRFNNPLIGWNTSKVTDMSFMFRGARNFNRDIGSWDVSKVINMQAMFFAATAFNRNIGNWDVSSVTNMTAMFASATAFNQDLSKWCVSNFSTQPTDFDTGANTAWIAKSVWGTCPLDTYNLNAFFDPDSIYPNNTGLLPNKARLKWTGQNLSPTFQYEFFNSTGTGVGLILSVTGNEAIQDIEIGPSVVSFSWLAGRVTGTSTIDGSKVVAYARINVIVP